MIGDRCLTREINWKKDIGGKGFRERDIGGQVFREREIGGWEFRERERDWGKGFQRGVWSVLLMVLLFSCYGYSFMVYDYKGLDIYGFQC